VIKHGFLIAALVLVGALSASAQEIEITASGTITSSQDSSIEVGTPITLTFDISSATPGVLIESGSEEYTDATGSGTAVFGNYSLTYQGISVDVFHDQPDGSYGYQFISNPSSYVALFSSNPVTSGSSLADVQVLPLSDFNQTNSFFYYSSGTSGQVTGQINSYTVTETPEPPLPMLAALGLIATAVVGLKWQWRRRQDRFS
jgi:hypothetical protein